MNDSCFSLYTITHFFYEWISSFEKKNPKCLNLFSSFNLFIFIRYKIKLRQKWRKIEHEINLLEIIIYIVSLTLYNNIYKRINYLFLKAIVNNWYTIKKQIDIQTIFYLTYFTNSRGRMRRFLNHPHLLGDLVRRNCLHRSVCFLVLTWLSHLTPCAFQF